MPAKSKNSKKIKREQESSSWFTFVTHDLILADKIKLSIRDYKEWAWIRHLPDSEEGSEHVHFLICANGTRTIKQVSDKIGLPSNFIQICRSVVGTKRYFLHLDNPEKQQYSFDDIHTNNHRSFRDAINPIESPDLSSLFQDYCSLRNGTLSSLDFITRHYREIEHLSFYQKIKTFDTIYFSQRTGST